MTVRIAKENFSLECVWLCEDLGLGVQALEFAHANAASLSEAHDHDVVRFDDGSTVKIYINADHEITMIAA